MLEGEDFFEEKSLKSKMTQVVKLGVKELNNWFYERGVSDNLPRSWKEFKEAIV